MKRYLLALLAALFFLFPSIASATSNITDATYYGIIVVTNNGTATTEVSTVLTLSSSDLITQGWADTDFDNIAIRNSSGADVPFGPSVNSTYPWSLWMPSIGANSQSNYTMYSGPSSLNSTKYYFPGSAGMTTADHTTLEPSDNFTWTANAYVDTDNGTDKNLVYKSGAIKVYVSPTVSGNVTVALGTGSSVVASYTAGYDNDLTVYGVNWRGQTFTVSGQVTISGVRLYVKRSGSPGDITVSLYNTTGASDNWTPDGVVLATQTESANAYNPAYAYQTIDFVAAVDLMSGTHAFTVALPAGDAANRLDWGRDASAPAFAGGTGISSGNSGVTWTAGATWDMLFYVDGDTLVDYVSATGVSSGEKTVRVSLYDDVAVTYDGINDYVDLGAPAAFDLHSAMTISAWVNLTDYLGTYSIVYGDYGVGADLYNLTVNQDGDGILRWMYTKNAGGTYIRRSTALTAGQWYKIDAVRNADDTLDIYLNGSLANNGDAGTPGVVTVNALTQATIGRAGAFAGQYFKGIIDEVRIYSRAITAGESSTDYTRGRVNNPQPSNMASLEGWYPSDEGTGVTATDFRGASNGTLTGGATWYDRSLKIWIDGVETAYTAAATISVPNNANNWTFLRNGVMPYAGSDNGTIQQIWIDGVLRQHITWEYATTFSDQSGNGHDAVPSFRTTSSDADVSASLISWTPIAPAIAPAYAVSDAPDFIIAVLTTSGNFTSTVISTGGPPGSNVPDDAADTAGVPRIWIWGILAMVTIVMIGLGFSYMEREFGGGGGTLLLRCLMSGGVVIGVMIAWGKFDFWMMVYYIILVAGIALASRHTDVSGNVGQLNLVGFLAQSWIGLTLINRIQEGTLLAASETSFLNNLMFTQEFALFGVFKIPVMNFQFFTEGIPKLLKWDYSFFGGNAQIIQYMLYSLTAVMSLIIFGLVIGLLYNYFNRLR